MTILPIVQANNDDELTEVKRKLETAVKGLKDIKEHMVSVSGDLLKYSTTYKIAVKCLKDLGVE